MYCQNCGQEMRDGAKFCDNCGTPVIAGNKMNEPDIPQNDQSYSMPDENEDQGTDGLCIAGFIFAFICPIIGWILCGEGIKRANKSGKKGAKLAKAGNVIGMLNVMLGVALFSSRYRDTTAQKQDEQPNITISYESLDLNIEDPSPVVLQTTAIQSNSVIGGNSVSSISVDDYLVRDIVGYVDGNTYFSELGNITYTRNDNAYFVGQDYSLMGLNEISNDARLVSVSGEFIVGQIIQMDTGELFGIGYIYDPDYDVSTNDESMESFLNANMNALVSSYESLGFEIVSSEITSCIIDSTTCPSFQIECQTADGNSFVVTEVVRYQENQICTYLYFLTYDYESVGLVLNNVHFVH